MVIGVVSGSSLFVTGSLGRRVRTHRLGLLLIGTSGSSVSWCGQPGEESPSWLGPATAAVRLEVGLEPFAAKKRLASLHVYSLAYNLSAYGGVHA